MRLLPIATLGLLAAVPAQRAEPAPAELEGVGITERIGSAVPADAEFVNEKGRRVRIGDYFGRGKPIVFTFNYARCPMLCKLQLEGLVSGLRGVEWTPGEEFEIVTLSIDPEETAAQTRRIKARYLELYGRPEAAAGWHFLRGSQETTQAFADALGFGYRFVPESNEFAHAACLMIASPSGKLCRYLYGVTLSKSTLELGLVEAGEGKIGSAFDRFLLFCFRYDSKAKQYTPAAFTLMRIGGILTILLLAGIILGVRAKKGRTPAPTALAAAPLLLVQDDRFWTPPAASTYADRVDWLFYFCVWMSAFFLALIAILTVVFIVRYRRRDEDAPGAGPTHSTALEILWSVIPAAVVGFVFVVGFKDFLDIRTPPENAYEIQVSAQKWQWNFTYPNGHVTDALHVPRGIPVKLVMSSEDVIHSLYVPAFRAKMDVVPGRYTTLWFEATRNGEYDLYCAEYCGLKHSDMVAAVVVQDPSEFDRWLANAADFLKNASPADAGKLLFRARGCTQCHNPDGTAGIGPSLVGIFGKLRRFKDGTKHTADENYIRESILEPGAKIVAGYEPVMPTYKGRLTDREITALIAYLKSAEPGATR